MKRLKVFGITTLVLIAIVAILMYNKSRMEAKSQRDAVTDIPVTVTSATKQKLNTAVSLVGTIAADNDVAIVSETQGRVTRVAAEVGDRKQAGATLVQVDDELKKAAYATAETNYEKAKRDLSRFESLSTQSAATDQQVEGVRLSFKAAEAQYITARREYNDTRITTPIAGIVTARTVDVGTYVQKGMPIGNVVDISKLKVKINVVERDVFKLHPGDPVEVTTDVYPGVVFDGKISTISSKADEGHTYPVEVAIPNNTATPLKAGMFGRVNFVGLANLETVTIPRNALAGSMRKPQVFVVEGTLARLRNIVVGAEIGTSLAVLSGLKEGETIIVSGQNNLKDSVAVAIVK